MNHYLFKYSFYLIGSFFINKRVTSVVIHSPSSFSIYFREVERNLYIDLSPQSAFVYPIEYSLNKAKDLNVAFFAFLKKKLPGLILKGVSQRGSERMGELIFEDARGEIRHNYRMIIEMIGRVPNIVFTAYDHEILQAYRYLSSSREIMPHRRYVQPVIEMPDLLSADMETLKLRYRYGEDILGFSSSLRKLVRDENEFEELVRAIRSAFEKKEFTLCLYGKKDVYPFRFGDPCTEVDDRFVLERFVLKPKENEFANRKKNLKTLLNKRLKSLNRRLSKIKEELSASEDADKYRIMAENLMAHPSLDVRYRDSVVVEDVYTLKPLKIELNPRLSLFENAQLYFKKHKKALKSREMIQKRLKETKMEIEFIEQLLFDVENAANERELNDIRDIMIKEGIIRAPKKMKHESSTYRPYEHIKIAGFDVYVGKNARGNDYVTLRLASKNDMWFHAHGRVGAHLIVKLPSKLQKLDESVKIMCAKEVAKRTRAFSGEKIEVAYTLAKHVRKPRGFKTGLVLYTNFKTIVVEKE